MIGSNKIQKVLFTITICCLVILVLEFALAQDRGAEIRGVESGVEAGLDNDTNKPVVEPRDNITVVTADSTALLTSGQQGPRKDSNLIAFAPNGSIYYHNSTHDRYWDVDPVGGKETTVEYVYTDRLRSWDCQGKSRCTQNGVERVNLTTGETTQIFSERTRGVSGTRWHDVDRIGENRLLVADIAEDRVFIVNTTTANTTWEWQARANFNTSGGGEYPYDWTHINDVEYIEISGRSTVMVSIRNFDQIVFIDVERGLRENWTLGSDDDYDILYEQHNPDFIPADNGGPAVLVSDSENGRIVEYQRRNGSWEQSWDWSDQRMTWPRDADRLPNGHTLITDSNGDRVFEVDENGTIVWSVDIGFPYEAERLGTGDESTNGPSSVRLNASNREPEFTDRSLFSNAVALLPPWLVSAVAYIRPGWVGLKELLAIGGLLIATPSWAILEWWSRTRDTQD